MSSRVAPGYSRAARGRDLLTHLVKPRKNHDLPSGLGLPAAAPASASAGGDFGSSFFFFAEAIAAIAAAL